MKRIVHFQYFFYSKIGRRTKIKTLTIFTNGEIEFEE